MDIRSATVTKPLFRRSASLPLKTVIFAVLACVLLAADHQGLLSGLRAMLTTAVYPLQQMVSVPVGWAAQLAEAFSSRADLLEQNRRLRDQELMLQARMLKFASLEQENIRLRGLLESSFTLGEQMQIAEVLSVNVVPHEQRVVVNKGTRYSAEVGQPVFDATGVVGQVVRVNPYSAEVMLITDLDHGIPVEVNRTGLRTVAVGTGQIDRLVLPYLSGSADIRAGDLLVTSGMGGVFPKGYPVATVTDVGQQSSPFAKVSAEPTAKLGSMREVLLVWSSSEPIPRFPAQARSQDDISAEIGSRTEAPGAVQTR
jgi:rod shape-determining protein MreC